MCKYQIVLFSLYLLYSRNAPIHLCMIFDPLSSVMLNAHGVLVRENQRISGPVNAHPTPGPDIYFNAFIHVYSPRAGADNPLGTNVDVNRKPLSLCPFVASFKTISLKYNFKLILNDFTHVYSPRAGTDNQLGTKF